MVRSSKEKNSASNSKKRAAIAAFLLSLVMVLMILIKRYQPTPPEMPQNTPSADQSTTSDTKPQETPETTTDKEKPAEIRTHHLQEEDRQFLIERGLKDPINDLVKDLMKHNELIPCEGEVGGTPGFYDSNRITVINKESVTADYDDGHVEGTIELTFTVTDGMISWKVVKAECGD